MPNNKNTEKWQEQFNADKGDAAKKIDTATNGTPVNTNVVNPEVNTDGASIVNEQGAQSATQAQQNSISVGQNTSLFQQQTAGESYVEEPDNLADIKRKHDEEYVRTHPGYRFDEQGNIVEDKTFFDALNLDRGRLRKERERQERIQRIKQLESGLAESAKLVSDMVSAGIGGNVYKRDKDTTSEDAAKEITRLKEQQIADDMAAKEADRKRREQWSADYWKSWSDRYNKSLHSKTNNQSQGYQSGVQSNEQVSNSSQLQTSHSTQATTYDEALKGNGLRGYSRRSYGLGGSGKQNLTYWPIKIVNGAHGEEYMSFVLDKEEKESLSKAIASSIDAAADSGNQAAIALRDKYYKKLKKEDKSATWDLDALVNNGALYQVPGVLNRYLDELTQMGIAHDVNGQQVPYTRRELYVMMTGDAQFANVPAGVNLGQSRL